MVQNTDEDQIQHNYYDPAYVDMWPLSRLPETALHSPVDDPSRPVAIINWGRSLILHAYTLKYIGNLFR